MHAGSLPAQALAIAAKEWRVLVRNPHALVTLFVMPALFLLVMSFALRDTVAGRADLPATGWVQEDGSAFATAWAGGWLAQHPAQRYVSRRELLQALKDKRVAAGVVVTAPLFDTASGRPDPARLELWLGQRLHPAAAGRLRAELTLSLLQASASPAAAAGVPQGDGMPMRYLYEVESGKRMTAVQQSVPAWLIFGMFFVVIPVAGVLVQERNEGTLARLTALGVSAAAILGGKLLAFMALNGVQLAFMLMVGRWLVPALGGDALRLDIHGGWFLLMAVATSGAAVGLALLIASSTRNFEHAAALGGGINVLLAAVAGVMVPRVLMPPGLQAVSAASPMGWALDGMQDVFLGSPQVADMLPRAGPLLAFAALCLLGSAWLLRRARRD
jgi:ABC-2 type transport system permease protein